MGSDQTIDRTEGQSLAPGYKLEEYTIQKSIGSGGFGVTYLAIDENLKKKVAIKEYFPFHLCFRSSDATVAPRTQIQSDLDEYSWGLDRFIDEARVLARFEHPNVISVLRYIEKNDTAYIVMDFADGRPLSELLRKNGKLSESRTEEILFPLMDGLAVVHEKEMLHRDIKPSNIIIREDATPVLIDFGAARQAVGSKSKSLSAILTPHYAPIEQYSTRGDQGPWTDIYALAAVAYCCLTGEKPPEATERMQSDPYRPLTSLDVAARPFAAAIDWALSPGKDARPRSVADWRRAFDGELSQTVARPATDAPTIRNSDPDATIAVGSGPPAGAGATVSLGGPKRAAQAGERTVFDPQYARTPGSQAEHSQKDGGDTGGSLRGIGAPILGVIGVAIAGALVFLAMSLSGEDETQPQVADGVEEKKSAETTGVDTAEPINITAPADPKNESLTEADREEFLAFDAAREINTPEAMEIYLRLHPNGKNADAARARLDSMRR